MSSGYQYLDQKCNYLHNLRSPKKEIYSCENGNFLKLSLLDQTKIVCFVSYYRSHALGRFIRSGRSCLVDMFGCDVQVDSLARRMKFQHQTMDFTGEQLGHLHRTDILLWVNATHSNISLRLYLIITFWFRAGICSRSCRKSIGFPQD